MLTDTEIRDRVAKARKHLRQARTMIRNIRIGAYQGRNNGGSTFRWHEQEAEALMSRMPRQITVALRDEHQLAIRISESKDAGMGKRPELQARLAAARKTIKGVVA